LLTVTEGVPGGQSFVKHTVYCRIGNRKKKQRLTTETLVVHAGEVAAAAIGEAMTITGVVHAAPLTSARRDGDPPRSCSVVMPVVPLFGVFITCINSPRRYVEL